MVPACRPLQLNAWVKLLGTGEPATSVAREFAGLPMLLQVFNLLLLTFVASQLPVKQAGQ
jgi:hypothetical protein